MDPAGAELNRELVRRLTWASVLSNGLGGLDVFVFISFLLPLPLDDAGASVLINAIVLAVFGSAALVAGNVWGRRQGRPIRDWLYSGAPAGPRERELVLRQPLQFVQISATFWGLAIVLFTAVNAASPAGLLIGVAVTIALGGFSTCALQYLLVERLTRPLTARALASGPPTEPPWSRGSPRGSRWRGPSRRASRSSAWPRSPLSVSSMTTPTARRPQRPSSLRASR